MCNENLFCKVLIHRDSGSEYTVTYVWNIKHFKQTLNCAIFAICAMNVRKG